VWWLAGTSLSLRNAEMIARSAALKLKAVGHTGIQSGGRTVRVMPLVFAEVETFKAHLHDVVGEALDSLVESELMWDLFDMFRGRARPVTLLAHGIRRLSVNHTLKPDAIRHIALLLRDGALNPGLPTSYIADLLRKLELAAYKEHAAALGKVVTAIMTGASDAVSGALKVHVELFESAIGQLVLTPVEESTDAILKQVVLIEPLAQEAVVMAFMIHDPDGPLFSQSGAKRAAQKCRHCRRTAARLASWPRCWRRRLYITHVAVAIATAAGSAITTASIGDHRGLPDEAHVKFATCRCDDIALALGYDAARAPPLTTEVPARVFAPKVQAHPDWIHTINGKFGLLGQVKFTHAFTPAQWEHAVRTTSRACLFRKARRCEPNRSWLGFESECAAAHGGDGGAVDARLRVLRVHARRAAERRWPLVNDESTAASCSSSRRN
jgi:hypothetical protein